MADALASPQEPAEKSIDLDALTAQYPDVDLAVGYQNLLEDGYTDFTWQGTGFKAGQEPEGFLAAPQPVEAQEPVTRPQDASPQPLATIPLDKTVLGAAPVTGQPIERKANATEYWSEALDRDVSDRERGRIYDAYAVERQPLWEAMRPESQRALLPMVRPDMKMTEADWEAFAALKPEEQALVKKERQRYLDYEKEHMRHVAPEWGEGFLGRSANDRHATMTEWLKRPAGDPFVEKVVRPWVLKELGPESEALWAQAETIRDQSLMMELTARVGSSLDQAAASEALGVIDALEQRMKEARYGEQGQSADLSPEAEWLGLIYLQAAKRAKEEGRPFEEIGGMPVFMAGDSPWRGRKKGEEYARRGAFLRNRRDELEGALAAMDESGAERHTFRRPMFVAEGDKSRSRVKSRAEVEELLALVDEEQGQRSRLYGEGREAVDFEEMAERARQLIVEEMRAKYGEDAADLIGKSLESKQRVIENSLKLFEQIDPEVFDKTGVTKDKLRYQDLQDMLGLAAKDEMRGVAEMRGRVDTASWFFDALLWANRKAGGAIESVLGTSTSYAYLMPDGTVWKDPIEVGRYVESKLAAEPERYIWLEDRDLASSIGEFTWDYQGKDPIKPTIIPADADMLAQLDAEEFARESSERTIFEALFNRFSSGLAPDDKIGRGVAGTAALSGDVLLEPLNFATGGVATAGRSVARYRKHLDAVKAAGIEVPEAATKLGVKTVDDIIAEVNGVSKAEAKKLGHRDVYEYADGTRVSPWAVPRFKLMQRLFGGGKSEVSEEAAQAMMTGAKRDPQYFHKLRDAVVKDEVFQMQAHRWFRSAGVDVKTVQESADLMKEMLPTFERIATGQHDIGYLEKLQNSYRRMATANPEAAWEQAKGLYVGRYLGTPLVTDAMKGALKRGGEIAKAGLELMPGRTEKWLTEGRKGVEAMNQARLLLRSGVRFDTVWSKELGGMRLDPATTEALRGVQRGVAANQGYAEKLTNAWARKADMKMLPDSYYQEVGPILEYGGDLSDAAMREAVLYRRVEKAVKDGRLHENMADPDIQRVLEGLRETVTKDEILKMRKRWEPHEEVLTRARDHNEWMRSQGESKGIFLGEENYATHLLRPPKNIGKKEGGFFTQHGVINELGSVKMKDPLSKHNVHRSGPPTLVEALAYGFRPVMDSRVAMLQRTRSFLDDMAQAEALTAIAHNKGVAVPFNGSSLQAILGDKYNVGGRIGDESLKQLVRESSSKAKAMQEGYKGLGKTLRQVRGKQARLDKALKDRGLTADDVAADPELSLLHGEVEALRQAHRQAVADFATEYSLNAEYQARLLEHTTVGGQEARFRYINLKKKLKSAKTDELDSIKAELRQVSPIRDEYMAAESLLKSHGLSQADISGVLYDLYGQPTIWHLDPADMRAFVHDNKVRLEHILRGADDEGRIFLEDIGEATKEFRERGKPKDEIFVKWTPNDYQRVYQELENVYLPVEVALALKSRGFRIGAKDALGEAAVFGAFGRAMDWVNRQFKGNVTVYNPSLHFKTRNQIDAWTKMLSYSGMSVMSPSLRREFNLYRRGKLDYITTATGEKLSAKAVRDDAAQLWQTYEQRIGIENTLQPSLGATSMEIAEQESKAVGMVKKNLDRAAKAQAPDKFMPSLGKGSTAGRPERPGESLFGYGPQSAEVFDNKAKDWVYFVNRKMGRSKKAALAEAFNVGRDYTNRTGFETWFVSRFPVLFYNFHKQNLKSIYTLLKQGNFGRLALPEKLLNALEADMPEDMRPEWMDEMTAIMGADAVYGINRDLSGVGVLDPYATLINGLARKNGWVTEKQAVRDFIDTGVPAFQYSFGPVMEHILNLPEGRKSRLRLPPKVQAEIYDLVGNADNDLFKAGKKSGKATVTLNPLGEFVLGLSGLSVWASTVNRHWDAATSGDPWDMAIQLGGVAKKYPYGDVAFQQMGDYEEFFKEMAESMWAVEAGQSGLRHSYDMPPEVWASVQAILRHEEMLGRSVRNLYTIMRKAQPNKPLPEPPEDQ